MPVESFLINPVKRRRKAWKPFTWKAFKRDGMKTNYWAGDTAGHRKAAKKGWKRRAKGISGMAHPTGGTYPRWNPFGEEVMIVGANPRKKRRYALKRKRHNPLGLLAGNRAVTSYKRRRNPVARGPNSNISIDRPATLLYPIAIGVASKMATERIPGILNITAPATRYVIQGAIGIGGGMLLSDVVGKTNATIWTITSGVTILVDMLNRFVFRTTLGYIGEGEEDLLAQEEDLLAQNEQMEAFPDEAAVGELAAFPDELAAFPDELGAFPYEKSPVY